MKTLLEVLNVFSQNRVFQIKPIQINQYSIFIKYAAYFIRFIHY